MSVLKFREEKKEQYILFYLEGSLQDSFMGELDARLQSLAKQSEPEFILLDLSELQVFAKNCVTSLSRLAETFSKQGRELAVCSCPAFLEMTGLFVPPLTYYPSEKEAVKAFSQSSPGSAKTGMDLLLTQLPILHLSIVRGPCKGHAVLREKQELVIGRHSKSDLPLVQDMQASRFHCRCYQKAGKFFLEDLKSCNGTILNGNPLQSPGELKDGDEVQVGDSIMQVKINYEEKIDSQACALPIPNLEIPQEETTPEQSGSAVDSMAQVFMDKQNEGKETVKFQLNTQDLSSLSKLYDDNIMLKKPDSAPSSDLQTGGDKLAADNVPATYNETESQDIALLFNQARTPTPVVRNYKTVTLEEDLDNQYRVIEILGESPTAFMLRCHDSTTGNPVFMQYAKEPTRWRDIPVSHPYLLKPAARRECYNRPLVVLATTGKPLSQTRFSETRALQIGIMLADVVATLHGAGIVGLDFSPCHTFCTENDSLQFAVIPTVAYAGASEEKADLFAIGAFLLEYASACKIPYTLLGGLDEEKIKKTLQEKTSASYHDLVMQLLHGEILDLDKLRSQLQRRFIAQLAPNSMANQAAAIQICQRENYLLSWVEGQPQGKSCYDEELAKTVSQQIAQADSRERIVELGRTLYRRFLPQGMVALLKEGKCKKLSLVLDEKLAHIPWELAHDGKEFLLTQFSIAREVWGASARKVSKTPLAFPKMMIVADIAPWAQKIKQDLAEMLSKEFPRLKLKVFDVTDRFHEIVRHIPMCGICHIIGQPRYSEEEPMTSGWVVASERRLLKLRFFDNAPRKPRLLFCQGEPESVHLANHFLGMVWQLGVDQVIGMRWAQHATTWPHSFYRALLQGNAVDDSLRIACHSADFRDSLCPLWYGQHNFPPIQKSQSL